jgi:hypothetical protein
MQMLYRLSYVGSNRDCDLSPDLFVERETGFEPATLSLEG